MSTRTHPSSQCKKLALTQPLSQKRWRNKSHIVMGIESETSLASAPANFCQKKNSKNSYNGSTLNPPQLYVPWDLDFHIYEKETPCIAYLWRLFYTSFTTTTHFSTRLTSNSNKYFYQSEIVWILTELQCTLFKNQFWWLNGTHK